MHRRHFLGTLAAGAGASVLSPVHAQPSGFPSRPIRMLVGFAPGGATDVAFRVLAQNAAGILKQPVVVENKPGAGMVIPAQLMQSTPPDGYTIAQVAVSVFRAPYLVKTNWDPLKDLKYIIGLASYSFGLVVPASSPIRTLADYLAYAKARPGELSYGTPGTLSSPHLTMEDLAFQAGVKFNHVPFKGGAEALAALLGGHIMSLADGPSWAQHVESGQLRLLATGGETRSARFSAAPTLRELGYDIVQNAPFGLAAPRDTDPGVVRVLHDAFKRSMDMDNYRAALKQYDLDAAYLSSEQFTRFAAETTEKEGRLIDRIGLRKL
ncbi:Tripartite tricarboxylate transporter family receptor [Pigmentiphaga humi]|uniref:Tripartite tricarboxylate transporter family receptor n=1 Tax=Pigmentiphaga humi TaxID=2478468 RepID=A0A3P4B0L1_9BURK|nr:tripartite tricarboxylate transporter substrate binding protein [Pigmentiphaga humi]VCU69270.1 Tripartite tricarboxylate transporter family receptor [Pigmentiphaga humi]